MTDAASTVRISAKLYDEIARRIASKSLQFESVDAFVEFALSDILDVRPEEALSPEDEETVSKRLSAFGY